MSDAHGRWYVNFREKGENASIGGFYRADSIEERDEVTTFLKECGFRVEYEPAPRRGEA